MVVAEAVAPSAGVSVDEPTRYIFRESQPPSPVTGSLPSPVEHQHLLHPPLRSLEVRFGVCGDPKVSAARKKSACVGPARPHPVVALLPPPRLDVAAPHVSPARVCVGASPAADGARVAPRPSSAARSAASWSASACASRVRAASQRVRLAAHTSVDTSGGFAGQRVPRGSKPACQRAVAKSRSASVPRPRDRRQVLGRRREPLRGRLRFLCANCYVSP